MRKAFCLRLELLQREKRDFSWGVGYKQTIIQDIFISNYEHCC